MRDSVTFASAWLLLIVLCLAQKPSSPQQLPPIAMPLDRATDSYAIYQSLIPLGETADKSWPHTLWLVADTTIPALPSDQPCFPDAKADASSMNPHSAVHPPPEGEDDFKQILEDFDQHCHDRIILEPGAWRLAVPVHLLTPAEQDEFRATRFGPDATSEAAAKYKGAPALYSFSEVYFNAHHTVALVYATHWCGGLCGEGFWRAFSLKDGVWRPLEWGSAQWIS